MNTQINPRTFTDQIPAYYEKTKFLLELGREDLALTHDYFFYKRLLLFYIDLVKAGDGATYLLRIEEILGKDRERAQRAFQSPAADPRDRKKLRLFYQSPTAYVRRVRWEERVVIPAKVRMKGIIRRLKKS